RRPFETALAQTQASLAQARAALAFAESDLARAQGLAIGTVITRQTFDQRTQAKRSAEAAVAAQEAVVRQEALDLEFTEMHGPVCGGMGDGRVSIVNLVTGGTSGNTSLLATIESVDPIRFEFTLDEASYLRYARLSKDGADAANRGLTVPVKLKLIDEPAFAHEGKMDFVDNAIDRSSSTIRARAVFTNPNGTFTPGMFARVLVAAAAPRHALLVPEAAIGTEQVGKFVLVIDAANVARPKYVKLGPVVDGLRVITEGLMPDDNVIINGLMRARPGVKVLPQQSSTASASAAGPRIDANWGTGAAHAPLPLLHRPAEFSRVPFAHLRDRWRGVRRAVACRPVSGDRTASGQGQRSVSRGERRHGRSDGGCPARAADQRRREHDLHHLELDGRWPFPN